MSDLRSGDDESEVLLALLRRSTEQHYLAET
jgi:hypothetical protein